jgi:hypothetical protein
MIAASMQKLYSLQQCWFKAWAGWQLASHACGNDAWVDDAWVCLFLPGSVFETVCATSASPVSSQAGSP